MALNSHAGHEKILHFQAPKTGRNPICVTTEDCFRGTLAEDYELCDEICVRDDYRRRIEQLAALRSGLKKCLLRQPGAAVSKRFLR